MLIFRALTQLFKVKSSLNFFLSDRFHEGGGKMSFNSIGKGLEGERGMRKGSWSLWAVV